jgi:uncharacterized membrane protein
VTTKAMAAGLSFLLVTLLGALAMGAFTLSHEFWKGFALGSLGVYGVGWLVLYSLYMRQRRSH